MPPPSHRFARLIGYDGGIEAGVAGFMGGLLRPSGSRTPPRLIEGPDTRTVASAGRTFDDPGAGPALVNKAGAA